jgi:hypothetical protein
LFIILVFRQNFNFLTTWKMLQASTWEEYKTMREYYIFFGGPKGEDPPQRPDGKPLDPMAYVFFGTGSKVCADMLADVTYKKFLDEKFQRMTASSLATMMQTASEGVDE